jgi:hypothetical protein
VRLVNGKTAFFEQPNAFRITIDAGNMMANGCQATASDQAHVTAAYYANLQKSLSGEAPHCMTIPLVLLVGTRVEDAFDVQAVQSAGATVRAKKALVRCKVFDSCLEPA